MIEAFSDFLFCAMGASPAFIEENKVYINPQFIEMVHSTQRDGMTVFVYRDREFRTDVSVAALLERIK